METSVFVHESALCESDRIGGNTRVWAFAHVMAQARIGADCNICDHVFVESGAVIGDRVTVKNNVMVWDGVTIEDEVFLGPNVVLTNDRNPRIGFRRPFQPTHVRRGATIGANATLVCPVTIGSYAFVGAGTVVLRDVPAHALVVGNPGRRIGWVCVCAEKLDADLCCEACGRTYSRAATEIEGLVAR
jgi:UDP-2-acetamido-3-amino-2,3-dideoxy-glucuronate N-acetyltransferase